MKNPLFACVPKKYQAWISTSALTRRASAKGLLFSIVPDPTGTSDRHPTQMLRCAVEKTWTAQNVGHGKLCLQNCRRENLQYSILRPHKNRLRGNSFPCLYGACTSDINSITCIRTFNLFAGNSCHISHESMNVLYQTRYFPLRGTCNLHHLHLTRISLFFFRGRSTGHAAVTPRFHIGRKQSMDLEPCWITSRSHVLSR